MVIHLLRVKCPGQNVSCPDGKGEAAAISDIQN